MCSWRHSLRLPVAVILMGLLLAMTTQAVAAKTKLRYFTWSDGTTIKEDWIAPFEKAHPDIEIEYESTSWGQFFTKLLAYTVAGNAPDLIHMSVGYVYEYAQKGMLVDLQPYFDRDLNPRDFFMEPMSAVRYPSYDKGDLYSIPFGFTLTTLHYNKGIFDTMGVGYPNNGWTWNTLRDAARKLVKDNNGDGKTDQWGFFSSYGYTNLDPVIHAFGGQVLDDQFNVRVDEPKAVEATKFMVDMIFKDQSAPGPKDQGDLTAMFAQGKLGMTIDINANIDNFRKQPSLDWDVALMPIGPAKRAVRLWPDSFAIMKDSKHADAAWEFIKFAITQKKPDRYVGYSRIPVYRPMAMSRDWMQEGMKPNKQVYIESVQYGEPMEFRPRWGDWNYLRNTHLGKVWKGESAPEYGLKAFADAIRQVLAAPAN